MRRIFSIVLIIVLISIPKASAQFLGQLRPAPTLNKGEALGGAYMGVYEDAFSIFGQFRYGIARYFDLGFKMGMIGLNRGYFQWSPGYRKSSTSLTVGGDIKYWFTEQRAGDPLDVSIGGGSEYLSTSDYSLFSLGGNIIASYQIRYYQEKSVTPYGRLNVRWEREVYKNVLRKNMKKHSDSAMDVALALGAELKLPSNLHLVGELEIDANVGFVAGINYGLF